MSLTAEHMRLLVDGGRDVDDLILAARAMERGDDFRSISSVIDALRETGATAVQIAAVVMAWAEDAVANKPKWIAHRDGHSSAKDSNRSRRGMPDHKWRALRQAIFERDEWACQYCGDGEDLTCDHIVPLVRGGTNDPDNLATACRSCNSSKGDKMPDEWAGRGW